MKYPLDEKGIEEIALDIRQHDLSQRDTILRLSSFLSAAMSGVSPEDVEWFSDAQSLLDSLRKRSVDLDNFRFNQSNGYGVDKKSPYEPSTTPQNEVWSEETTEAELAAHFNEPVPVKKDSEPVSKMTLEEIHSWESKQDNSNDIYKIAARVKNIARDNGRASLTDVGTQLCNTYTHVLKTLYDFADTVQDKDVKIKLTQLIRRNEGFPGNFIAATKSGIKISDP